MTLSRLPLHQHIRRLKGSSGRSRNPARHPHLRRLRRPRRRQYLARH